MKDNRRLVNHLVACAVAFAMVSTLAAQSIVSAKVIRIKVRHDTAPEITFGSPSGLELCCSPALLFRPVLRRVPMWI